MYAYDPALIETRPDLSDLLTLVDDPADAAAGAASCVVLTEWPQFHDLDWERHRPPLQGPVVYDFRNLLDPGRLRPPVWPGRASAAHSPWPADPHPSAATPLLLRD